MIVGSYLMKGWDHRWFRGMCHKLPHWRPFLLLFQALFTLFTTGLLVLNMLFLFMQRRVIERRIHFWFSHSGFLNRCLSYFKRRLPKNSVQPISERVVEKRDLRLWNLEVLRHLLISQKMLVFWRRIDYMWKIIRELGFLVSWEFRLLGLRSVLRNSLKWKMLKVLNLELGLRILCLLLTFIKLVKRERNFYSFGNARVFRLKDTVHFRLIGLRSRRNSSLVWVK